MEDSSSDEISRIRSDKSRTQYLLKDILQQLNQNQEN